VSAGLSVFLSVWGLLFVGFPFGGVGGAGAALFGVLFGFLALLSGAWGRWRRMALIGMALGAFALVVFAVLLVASLGAS
jgi:hypothetical protein